jgi:TPR repeat protein
MDIDDNNQQLVKANRNSVILSRPGQLLTRMTLDLLPLAQSKRKHDDQQAEPSFLRGVEAYALKDFQAAMRELTVAAKLGHRIAQFRLAMMYLDGIGDAANHKLAYHWFHWAAEQGDADSLNKLGWMCEAGFGVERDQARAVNWFRQAAERGHLEAQFNLAAKYDNGEGVSQNHAEAARWYRLAAEQGLADARFFLAQALESGEGVPRNTDEAIDWYILAAEQGHRSAKLSLWRHALDERYLPEDEIEKVFVERLGVEMQHPLAEYKYAYRLFVGEGVPKNCELALNLYKKSANKGFYPARAHLLMIYSLRFEGVGSIEADPAWKKQKMDPEISGVKPRWMYLEPGQSDVEAVSKFREHRLRSEGGDEDAISELACDYYFGRGTVLNHVRALEWLLKGVANNDVYCHYLLGYMLSLGISTPRDEEKALLHLKKAAKAGHVSATRMAADLLLEGDSDSKKVKQAVKLWTGLAESADAESQFSLGYIFSTGKHLPISHEKAVFWYTKAADQGHTAALFNLGVKYEFGTGVNKDQRLALSLYRRSAEGGLIRACEELSQIYEVGKFGEQSAPEAKRWAAEAQRLKIEKERGKGASQPASLSTSKTSLRRQRLEQKRSLQRKASELIGKNKK